MLVAGAPATKPTRMVGANEPVVVREPPPRFVSRGGEKLAPALDRFDIAVDGRRCLDAGSSTGGFTDALLQAGAASVIAVDVGRNQLHERIRADDRVDVRERTDIRSITPELLGGPVDLVVADLSFISTSALAGVLISSVRVGGDLVVLVKPQFEATRTEVSKARGVIRDEVIWRRVLGDACGAMESGGTAIMGAMVSPLRGAEGNAEFLVHARRHDSDASPGAPIGATAVDLDAVVAAVATGGA